LSSQYHKVQRLFHDPRGKFHYSDIQLLYIIVKYFSGFQPSGQPIMNIVMEYADAGDLSQCIAKRKEVDKEFFPEVRTDNRRLGYNPTSSFGK